jgi:AGCS family alanine or glycine:cation symporter
MLINYINSIILYPIIGIPLKLWLFIGIGLAIMFKIKFANITYFLEAITYAFSKKKESDLGKQGVGSITALMSQLAGNLGVGNFAGSALALYYGGPGVILWFFILSFFCSSIKFGEVVLAHKFRKIENDEIKGGTFYFIETVLKTKFMGIIWVYAV